MGTLTMGTLTTPLFKPLPAMPALSQSTALLRLVLCGLCLLFAAGCSTLRVGYGHADSVAGWMANDYFDLNPDQREGFGQRFERLHAWHRQEELPEYARLLQDMQQRVQRGLQETDVLWLIDGFKRGYARIAARGAPDAATLLATLTPEQIDNFRRQLDKDNRKFLRENRSTESETERRKAAEQRTLGQVRDWVGRLSPEQENRMRAMLKTLPLTDQLRHEDRLRRQREFLALLEQRNNPVQFQRRLRTWLEQWEAGRSEAQSRLFEESWKKRAEFYAAVERMLTTEQRAHLLRRLQDYIDDFRELAARPQGSRTASAG